MGGGTQPPERVGEVGPVELTPDSAEGPVPAETAVRNPDRGPLERRLHDWWGSLDPRRRRVGSALLGLAAAVALGVPAAGSLDRHAPAPQPPWPAQLTDVQYQGISSGSGQDSHRFTIRILVTDIGTAQLTVNQVVQGYPGLSLTVTPRPPLTARPGQPLALALHAVVHDCATIPPNDAYPVLILTVSNSRATQTQSEALGDPYILAMHSALLRACRGTPGFGGPFPQSAANSGVFPP